MEEQISSYMQSQENEIVRLADELIGANTVNPPGNERLAVNIVEKYFNPKPEPFSSSAAPINSSARRTISFSWFCI